MKLGLVYIVLLLCLVYVINGNVVLNNKNETKTANNSTIKNNATKPIDSTINISKEVLMNSIKSLKKAVELSKSSQSKSDKQPVNTSLQLTLPYNSITNIGQFKTDLINDLAQLLSISTARISITGVSSLNPQPAQDISFVELDVLIEELAYGSEEHEAEMDVDINADEEVEEEIEADNEEEITNEVEEDLEVDEEEETEAFVQVHDVPVNGTKPVTNTTSSNNTTNTNTTSAKPSTNTTDTKPTTNTTTTTKPSTNTTDAKPSTNSTTTKPSTNTTDAKPSTNSTTTKPSTNTTDAKSSTNSTTTKPSTNSTDAKPSTNSTNTTDAKPSTNSTNTKPSTNTTDAKPSTNSTDTKPSTNTTDAKPSTNSTDTTKPGNNTTIIKPTKPVKKPIVSGTKVYLTIQSNTGLYYREISSNEALKTLIEKAKNKELKGKYLPSIDLNSGIPNIPIHGTVTTVEPLNPSRVDPVTGLVFAKVEGEKQLDTIPEWLISKDQFQVPKYDVKVPL